MCFLEAGINPTTIKRDYYLQDTKCPESLMLRELFFGKIDVQENDASMTIHGLTRVAKKSFKATNCLLGASPLPACTSATTSTAATRPSVLRAGGSSSGHWS